MKTVLSSLSDMVFLKTSLGSAPSSSPAMTGDDVFPDDLAFRRHLEDVPRPARDAQRIAVGQSLRARDVPAVETVGVYGLEAPDDLVGGSARFHLGQVRCVGVRSVIGIDLKQHRVVPPGASRTVIEDQKIAGPGQSFLDPLGIVVVEEHPVAFGSRIAVRVVVGRLTGVVERRVAPAEDDVALRPPPRAPCWLRSPRPRTCRRGR